MTEPGAHFDRFQLLGVLGRGGFATVYQAHDPALERDVALKTLLPHLAEDPQLGRRFLNEVRAIARLSHPNIVTIFEAGESAGRPYYTMELIAGRTLADELQTGGPFSLDRALTILRSLAAALDHLHAAGLVHRDVKPANIMLAADGRVLLMDFGIARVLEDTRFTQSGASLGTPAYMAPEQVLDQDVDPPADIYALGIVAYQLLAGRPPFMGATVQVLHAQAYEPPPALRDLCPDLPDAVYAAINTALAKDPAQRQASANELVQQITGTAATPAIEPAAEAPAASATTPETPIAQTQPYADQDETERDIAPPTPLADQGENEPVASGQDSLAGLDEERPAAAPPDPIIVQDETLLDLTPSAPLLSQAEVAQPLPPELRDATEPGDALSGPADGAGETDPAAAPAPSGGQAAPSPAVALPEALAGQHQAEPAVARPEALARATGGRPDVASPTSRPAKPRRRSSRRSRLLLACLGAAALLVLIAAGAVWAANRGGGGNGAGNAGTYQQLASDNHFSVTRFAARVGQPLTVTLRNTGQHQHNLHILVADTSGNEARTPVLQGGQSTTFTVVYNTKGSWAFRCDVFPTEMNGSIDVN